MDIMAPTESVRARAREKLDERLLALKPESRFVPPPKGWIRAIRDALGMTGAQFAARLGIKPPSVNAWEKSEATGTIQLKTLRRAAEALDCTLVYALVPNASLEQSVDERARTIARRALGRISHTMRLEDQSVDQSDLDAKVDAYIRDHIKGNELWAERD